jgi:hypothetical protein
VSEEGPDYDRLHESGSHMPAISDYLTRLLDSGAGGTCWTLARGFHWSLGELGVLAHYLYRDPGHVCLAVELGQRSAAPVLGSTRIPRASVSFT